MLEVDGIETFYGETQALFGVSLAVGAGEVVALLGPNGAGKTTTLRSILGLTPARTGSIRFDGHDVTRAPTHEIARRGLAWVPDDRRIFPTLTVARNLSIARKKTRFRGWTEKECFEIFSALEYLMHRECENLSGGEMQMVAISRALVGAPGLVLFDEPSQGLAPKVVQDVMKTILRLKSEGRRRAGRRAERRERARGRGSRLRHEPRRDRASRPGARPRGQRGGARAPARRLRRWPHRCCTSTRSPSATPAARSTAR